MKTTREEKRGCQRLKLEENGFVHAWVHGAPWLGIIQDISQSGVGLTYLAEAPPPEGSLTVDVFACDNTFHLFQVTCRVTYVTCAPPAPFSRIRMNRCGMQFDGLSDDQMKQLSSFLQDLAKRSLIMEQQSLWAQNSLSSLSH